MVYYYEHFGGTCFLHHKDRRLSYTNKIIVILTEVLKQGQEGLQDTVRQLECDQKETLLKCATVWNCNSKNCHPAQVRLEGFCSIQGKTSEQTFNNCGTIFTLQNRV
jgi:hypothetical protein